MTELAQENNNKKFILGIAFLQGLALLLIWLWVDTLDNARQYFDQIDKDQQAELIVLSNYSGRVYSKSTEGWDFVANIHLECCNNQTNKSAEVLARELEVALVEGKI